MGRCATGPCACTTRERTCWRALCWSKQGARWTLTVLHTTDEHGWLDTYAPEGATKVRGGVANLLSLWRNEEHFGNESHLVLSGGDNMSGPAVSTWFRGEPAVEAMNFVGYQASVIGNHEFDFGVDGLRQRIEQARFPYLGANIIDESTGKIVDFAIPYVVIPHRGVNVGVIGVTTPDTATDAHPLNVSGLRFEDIATTLEEQVPILREEEGADVVVVVAHECCPELEEVARGLSVDVDLMFGAHMPPSFPQGSQWDSHHLHRSVLAILRASRADLQPHDGGGGRLRGFRPGGCVQSR